MMNRSSVAVGIILAAAVISTGCEVRERGYVRPRRAVVVEEAPPQPQPVYVQPAPAPAPVTVYAPPPPQGPPVVLQAAPPVQEQVLVVNAAPPPPYAERRPRRPGAEFVWLSGYWVIHANRWAWVSGHWERPPHPGAVWVPHHWEQHGGAFHFTVGVWR